MALARDRYKRQMPAVWRNGRPWGARTSRKRCASGRRHRHGRHSGVPGTAPAVEGPHSKQSGEDAHDRRPEKMGAISTQRHRCGGPWQIPVACRTGRLEHFIDVQADIGDVVPAPPGIFLQTSLQRPANSGRRLRRQCRPIGVALENRRDAIGRVRPGKFRARQASRRARTRTPRSVRISTGKSCACSGLM